MLKPLPQSTEALQQADATLRSLMLSARAQLDASPLDLAAVKTAFVVIFQYLSSPVGRTDANCCAVDGFFYLDDNLPLESLPDSLQDVFAHMDALHDTITAPHTAKNFGSTPEQLLERVRDSRI